MRKKSASKIDKNSSGETAMPESSSATVPPKEVTGSSVNGGTSCEPDVEMLGNFPPEIATLLVIAGVAGVFLPGPIGTPLLIAGGVVLWPKTFRPIEKWFCRKFPAVHREGVTQLKEFVNDLNRRFPENESE